VRVLTCVRPTALRPDCRWHSSSHPVFIPASASHAKGHIRVQAVATAGPHLAV
jgi:hypothetical protein